MMSLSIGSASSGFNLNTLYEVMAVQKEKAKAIIMPEVKLAASSADYTTIERIMSRLQSSGDFSIEAIIFHAVLEAIDHADEISLEMAAAFVERSMEVRNSHG